MSNFKIVKLVDPIQLNLAGGLNFQGDYDNATAYVVGDVVTYNGSSYAATQGTTGNLPTDTSNWQLLAEKGDPLTVNAGTNIDIDTISATEITVNTVVDDDAALTANSATAIASQKATKSYADTKVTSNAAIVGATKTKITYDAKGLVTAGADATTADIADSTDKRYVTDANLTVIGNTSGTNTGDNATNTQYSGLDAAKVNKAGDTMTGDLNMGTKKLIGGTGVTDVLKLQGTTGNGTAASAAIQLLTGNNGGTTALTVLNNGNVGIGTTSPSDKLHVASAKILSPTLMGLTIQDTTSAALGVGGGLSLYGNYTGTSTTIAGAIDAYKTNATDGNWDFDMRFQTRENSTYGLLEVMRLTANRRVGIGTATPSAILNTSVTTGFEPTLVHASNSSLTLTRNAGSELAFTISANSPFTASLQHRNAANDSSSYPIALNPLGGNVGIGTTSPSAKLQVDTGAAATVGQIIKGATSQTADLLQIQDSSANKLMVVSSGGKLGIGTTSPSELLHLRNYTGSAYSQAGIQFETSGSIPTTYSLGKIYSIWDGAGWGDGRITIATTVSSASFVDTLSVKGGKVGIGTTSPVAKLQVDTGAAGTIGQIIKGASAQTADLLQIQDSSANKLMVVSSGGKVGIGTTTPSNVLEISGLSSANSATQLTVTNTAVAGTSGGYGAGITFSSIRGDNSLIYPQAKITADGESNWNSAATQSSSLRFFTVQAGALAEKMRIMHTGNVGIGTTNPTVRLTVDNGSIEVGRTAAGGEIAILNGDATNRQQLKLYMSGTDAVINATRNSGTTANMLFMIDGSEKMRLRSDGNFGIGTTTPGAQLQVTSSAAATIGQIIKGASAQTADLLQIQDSSANKLMVVSSGGNVGIGVAAPATPLEVNGIVRADRTAVSTQYIQLNGGDGNNTALRAVAANKFLYIDNSDTSGTNLYNAIVFRNGTAGDTERMRVDANGNVGIGTTSPGEKLDVSGTVKATGYKSSDGSAGVSGSFTTTDGKTITIKDGLVVSIL